jgi:hypothetical protein
LRFRGIRVIKGNRDLSLCPSNPSAPLPLKPLKSLKSLNNILKLKKRAPENQELL